jgi:hypothetical protein
MSLSVRHSPFEAPLRKHHDEEALRLRSSRVVGEGVEILIYEAVRSA